MTAQVDFTSQAFFRDPAAGIERLRALGPVVETRFPIVGKVWITTTHESTARVLKDGETFTLRKESGGVAGLRWWMPAFVGALANSMLTMDEPDHTRLREIVDEAFRRRAVLDMEPRIRAIADDLAGKLFADGSPADLVARYARLLPLSVICELLGLPLADRPRFIAWANTVARLAGVTDFVRMIGGLWPMKRYLEERLRLARAQGGEGLIAELVRVEMEGGRISANEMVSMVFLLLGAGSETTTHLISGSVYELLRNPGLRDWLTADWSRGSLAVEEFLRFVSPVQFSKPRFVRRDIELEGVAPEEGRHGHGHGGGRQHGPGRDRAPRATRSCAPPQPAHLVRDRNPFLPRPSARTARRHLRPAGAVHSLAGAAAGGRPVRYPLAPTARTAVTRNTAGRGRALIDRRSPAPACRAVR